MVFRCAPKDDGLALPEHKTGRLINRRPQMGPHSPACDGLWMTRCDGVSPALCPEIGALDALSFASLLARPLPRLPIAPFCKSLTLFLKEDAWQHGLAMDENVDPYRDSALPMPRSRCNSIG